MNDSESKRSLGLWVEESTRDTHRTSYRVKQTLFDAESPFQHVHIVETESFGRMLLNDSVVQICERDERVYHEMIVHVPLFAQPGIERVLIVGGGDGGSVRELLRHPSVSYCRLVEIDETVVEGCRKEIPQTAEALDDSRVEVTIGDGVAYVSATDDRYDLIVVDSSDPVGPAKGLFGPEFYSNARRILTDGGVVVTQANSPYFEMDAQKELLGILARIFRRVHIYNYTNMTYPGGLYSFSFASKGSYCPVGDLDARRVAESGLAFEYYNDAVHRAAFALPEFQLRALRGLLTPLR